jgi:hypothetical protein
MKEALITYKQWKTLNESFVGTFGSILTQPAVIGGVVGATGASNWSLEETKAKIRNYMLGEDDDSGSDDDAPPKKKKKSSDSGSSSKPKPKSSNPFGGGSSGGSSDDDDDDDSGSSPFGGGGGGGDDDSDDDSNPFGGEDDGGDDTSDDGDDDGMGGDDDDSDNPFGDDDDDMGGNDPMGGMGDDDDDMGGNDPMGGMGDDDDMDPMGGGGDPNDPMGGGMGGDDPMGGGGPGGLGASAKGHVCDQCGHHEPDKNAKFCKMCGKSVNKFMSKFMKSESNRSKDASYKIVSSKASKHAKYNDQIGDHASSTPGDDGSIDPMRTGKDMLKTVKDGRTEGKPNGFRGVMDGKASLHDNKMGKFKVVKGRRDQGDPDLDGFKPSKFGKGGKIQSTGKDPERGGRKKNEQICGTCGSLACEVHNGQSPNADRLSQSFFRSLAGQVGNRGGRYDTKFHDGIYDGMVEDALFDPKNVDREPGPGDAGWAPQGRIGFLGGI